VSTDQTTQSTEPADDGGQSRRWFLGAAAVVAAGGVLAACSKDDSKVTSGSTTTGGAGATTTTGAAASGDAKVAALAAGLEVLAVQTYKAALDAAGAKKLGDVPPAVATFATTAMGHHQKALDTWNSVLTGAGQPAVSTPPASLKATVDAKFAQAKNATDVATLALLLEQTAADTYLGATKVLTSKEAITTAGALQSVDQEHAAILLYVLGKYPVPDIFQKTDKAFAG